jgi:predicted transposase YdaD
VLNEAIERLRPEGERKMTTSEWLLYNILEMKFIRGLKVRDIARRLAMSESDLYRKQRVAISEVAKTLATLEQNEAAEPRGEE